MRGLSTCNARAWHGFLVLTVPRFLLAEPRLRGKSQGLCPCKCTFFFGRPYVYIYVYIYISRVQVCVSKVWRTFVFKRCGYNVFLLRRPTTATLSPKP